LKFSLVFIGFGPYLRSSSNGSNTEVLGRKARLAARLPAYGGQATIDIYIKKDKNKIIYKKILIQYEFC
jgi:hypothetical protein